MPRQLDESDVASYDQPRGETCMACRKRSDGAVQVTGPARAFIYLCGTHYDECLAAWKLAGDVDFFVFAVAFTKDLREGKYAPCWNPP